MKSARFFLMSFTMIALLFSSFSVEAKSNYSNSVAGSEEKVKAKLSGNFMPVFTVEEAPVFSGYKAVSFLDKYSPEQLNKLIGVWPDRSEDKVSRGGAVVFSESSPVRYSPEQLADILGLKF